MEAHGSFPAISELARKYPKTAGSLFTTYNDLLLGTAHVQTWSDLEVVEIPDCSRAALRGRRPSGQSVECVVPCSMTEVLSLGWVKNAFKNLEDPPEIYLAVCTDDSSLVYYKLSPGFAKPPL